MTAHLDLHYALEQKLICENKVRDYATAHHIRIRRVRLATGWTIGAYFPDGTKQYFWGWVDAYNQLIKGETE